MINKELFWSLRRLLIEILFKAKFIYKFLVNINKNAIFCKKTEALYLWDVRTNPISFDFTCNLYLVFKYFEIKGFIDFDLIVYIPEGYDFKPFEFQNYSKFVSSGDLFKRIDDLIIPLAKACPSVKRIKVITSKCALQKEINPKYKMILPHNSDHSFSYNIRRDEKKLINFLKSETKPLSYPGLKYSKSSLKLFNEIGINFEDIKSSKLKYVTLTLRDYGFSPLRNTNSDDIKIALQFCKNIKAKLILVPDSVENLSNYFIPKSIRICLSARKRIDFRIALYSLSEVNLFSNSGPHGAALFTKNAKAIIFRYGNGDPTDPYCDSSLLLFKKLSGLSYGDQPFLSLDSYYLWFKPNKPYTSIDLENALNKLKLKN